MSRARASAAGSVSNLGPGYDVLGLCLEGPRDVVEVALNASGQVRLRDIQGDGGHLPRDADQNCATVAAREVLTRFGAPGVGLDLWLEKGLPLGSGLGSSAASAVAAAVATASLVAPELPRRALLDACREGERLATGSPHPDNVAPSLLGGLVACVPGEGEAIDVVSLLVPEGLRVVTVKPDISVSTAEARAALPREVSMGDAVANVAEMAALITGLARGDWELVGRSLRDRFATPYRKRLIPGYDAVVSAAVAAGAVGAGISGSGPTLFALCAEEAHASAVSATMVDIFESYGLASVAYTSAVDMGGARVES